MSGPPAVLTLTFNYYAWHTQFPDTDYSTMSGPPTELTLTSYNQVRLTRCTDTDFLLACLVHPLYAY
ncbi:hypothetical protein DPMN_161798 [Dreissena polymorpha]|uniref:Uncharacterized protein n=1 Tax=Dreissena polymorpha TaxID=45954 RepID=A0A9D4EQE2_DREPO|nr:hypothetical protein DPMN_161798 [Dreissena polymorpha]